MKKKFLSVLLSAVMLFSVVSASAVTLGASGNTYTEPNNEKIDAEYEDRNLDLWFDHSFTKIERSDVKSTGLNTYTMKMAKNEIENCQFFLSSKTGHTDLKVEVSDFLRTVRNNARSFL